MLRVPAESLQAERRPPRNHMFICMQRKKQRAKDRGKVDECREDKKPRKHKTKRRTQRATTDRRGREETGGKGEGETLTVK